MLIIAQKLGKSQVGSESQCCEEVFNLRPGVIRLCWYWPWYDEQHYVCSLVSNKRWTGIMWSLWEETLWVVSLGFSTAVHHSRTLNSYAPDLEFILESFLVPCFVLQCITDTGRDSLTGCVLCWIGGIRVAEWTGIVASGCFPQLCFSGTLKGVWAEIHQWGCCCEIWGLAQQQQLVSCWFFLLKSAAFNDSNLIICKCSESLSHNSFILISFHLLFLQFYWLVCGIYKAASLLRYPHF